VKVPSKALTLPASTLLTLFFPGSGRSPTAHDALFLRWDVTRIFHSKNDSSMYLSSVTNTRNLHTYIQFHAPQGIPQKNLPLFMIRFSISSLKQTHLYYFSNIQRGALWLRSPNIVCTRINTEYLIPIVSLVRYNDKDTVSNIFT
jgi:hypothetical protein